jgi:uncharacterized protein (TIGR02996 family)
VTEERGLLEAIRAEPEDDTCRLVYADWLEENGQAERAELVRVQLALEKDGPSKPLLAREGELLLRHAAEWSGPLADAGLRFERGLAVACWESLEEFAAGTARLAEAGDPPWVVERWLHFSGPRFEEADFQALVRSPGYARLTRFYFGGYRASSGDQVWLLGATAAMARALAASPGSANLRGLWLINADLGLAGAEALAASPHLGRLRRLSVRHSALPPEGVALLAHSAALPALTGLGLVGHVANEEEDIRVLAAPKGLSRLESLNLSNNRVGDARLRRLLKAPWVGQLKELQLVSNQVRDGGVKEIAACAALSGLRRLDLACNRFGDEGARALLNSAHLRGLRHLSVWGNPKLSGPLAEQLKRRYGDDERPERYYAWLDWEV